jgi:hypothetical protein
VFAALAAQTAAAQDNERVQTIDHSIELYISEDALQAQYVRDLDIDEIGFTKVRGGVFYNEQRDLIGIADLLADLGEPGQRRNLEVRIGTRAYGAFLSTEDQDIFGLSVGGEAEYFLGRNRATSVLLTAFYSPDILTFGEADDVKDVSLRLQTRLRDNMDVFVGFRSFEIDTALGDREVDDNMHIGFRRSF